MKIKIIRKFEEFDKIFEKFLKGLANNIDFQNIIYLDLCINYKYKILVYKYYIYNLYKYL